jgi:hypothetical protein
VVMTASELEEELALYQTSPAPVFRFECAAGCHFGTEAQCRRILRTAIRDAIGLASGAAAALEGPPSARTVRIFRATFGHPPSRPVPWAGGRNSGAIVARRYRLAIGALQRRGTRYRCDNTLVGANARVLTPSQVLLGPSFWTQSRMHRAGTILHEMMHQYFLGFILHDQRERRRNNAHCFEVFALRVRGVTPQPIDVSRCRSRPA